MTKQIIVLRFCFIRNFLCTLILNPYAMHIKNMKDFMTTYDREIKMAIFFSITIRVMTLRLLFQSHFHKSLKSCKNRCHFTLSFLVDFRWNRPKCPVTEMRDMCAADLAAEGLAPNAYPRTCSHFFIFWILYHNM